MIDFSRFWTNETNERNEQTKETNEQNERNENNSKGQNVNPSCIDNPTKQAIKVKNEQEKEKKPERTVPELNFFRVFQVKKSPLNLLDDSVLRMTVLGCGLFLSKKSSRSSFAVSFQTEADCFPVPL
jgi:hypothetical protein